MKKLPIEIETPIVIRSPEQKSLKTSSRMLGARHGDFILIEEPVISFNERLFAHFEGQFLCSYIHQGVYYHFASKLRKVMSGGLALIEYPTSYHVEKVRQHPRVRVNLQGKFILAGQRLDTTFECVIRDISEGGCYLTIQTLTHLATNMRCTLNFVLPDDRSVTGMEGLIRNVQYYKLKKAADAGIQFTGPPEEIAKVRSFCEFCMYFKV